MGLGRRLEEEAVQGVWTDFLESGTRGARDRLVEHYMPLVEFLARRVGRFVEQASQEDLISFGAMGLMDALEKFDPSRGVRFETYAGRRIRGAMGDGLRTMSFFPRGAEKRASRMIEKVVPVDFQSARSSAGVMLTDTLSDPIEATPLDGVLLADDHAEVTLAVGRLPERERLVVTQHYFGERPLKSIGLDLGVTESRACQLHRRALRMLEAELNEGLSA